MKDDFKLDANGDLIEVRYDFRKLASDLDDMLTRIAVGDCSHAHAYDCAHCDERRCMACNEPCPETESIKSCVRFCPMHYEDGREGNLERGVFIGPRRELR